MTDTDDGLKDFEVTVYITGKHTISGVEAATPAAAEEFVSKLVQPTSRYAQRHKNHLVAYTDQPIHAAHWEWDAPAIDCTEAK